MAKRYGRGLATGDRPGDPPPPYCVLELDGSGAGGRIVARSYTDDDADRVVRTLNAHDELAYLLERCSDDLRIRDTMYRTVLPDGRSMLAAVVDALAKAREAAP